MSPGLGRHLAILVLGLLVGVAWCLVAAPYAGADPMLLFELISGGLATIWGVAMARNLLRGRRIGQELETLSEATTIDGIGVRVVAGGGRMAVVLGAVKPIIFVGDELLEILTDDERTAVLLHEDHHRASRAPIRAAAVEAWISILGRWDVATCVLRDRLADLEAMADQHAIDRGCSPASLAGALIKTDPSAAGLSAFSYAAERRIHALLGVDRGTSTVAQGLPYEWLPIALASVIAAACHLWGISFLT